MTRSRLKSKCNKHPTPENRLRYTKQRNICVLLRNKAIRYEFQIETGKGNLTNKDFYKLIKPYLTNKGSLVNNDIILVENDKIISEVSEVAETFNDYFVNIVKTTTGLSTTNIKDNLPSNTSNREVINAMIDNYREHPSIRKTNEFSKHVEPFSFNFVCQNEVNKYLKNVNVNKSTGKGKLPPKILQISANVLDKPLTTVINVSISEITSKSI